MALDEEAARRARKLLRSLLTTEQLADYHTTRHFTVTNPKPPWNRYTFRIGDTLQVRVYGQDRAAGILENWCGYLANAPREDTIIAQLLLLRDDPIKLRRMAEITSIYADGRGAGRPARPIGSFAESEELRQTMRIQALARARTQRLLERAGYRLLHDSGPSFNEARR